MEAEAIEQGVESLQAWVAPLRKHLIQALPIQRALRGDLAESARLRNIAKSHQKHTRVVVLERGVEVGFRPPLIFEGLDQIVIVRYASWHLFYSYNPSRTLGLP